MEKHTEIKGTQIDTYIEPFPKIFWKMEYSLTMAGWMKEWKNEKMKGYYY